MKVPFLDLQAINAKYREDLIAAVQTEIDSERTFREDLAAIWKLVTEETPQVFL
jgi:hypothetical protein